MKLNLSSCITHIVWVCLLFQIPGIVAAKATDVVVTINNVKSNDLDPFPNQGGNDLYAKVNIANQGFQQSPTLENANEITPSDWVFTSRFKQSPSVVPVDMEVWDEDIDFDDQVDISPRGKDLNVIYDASSGRIVSGDIAIPSEASDGQNGSVGFSIQTRGVSEYSQDLTFQSSGQSMWGTGASVTGSFNYFLGAEWDKKGAAGGISDVTVIPSGCLPWWLGGGCWDGVTASFGAEINGETDGRVGIDIGAKWDSGSVDIKYPAKVNLYFPDSKTLSPGESFVISSDFAIGPGADMTTVFPQATITADAIFDVFAQVGGEVCIAGCLGGSFPLINVNETVNLINISPNSSFTANFPGGLGSIAASIPNITTQASLDGDRLVSNGNDNILEARLDLDGVLTSLLALPPLEAGFSALGTTFSYNILDIEAGLTANIKQSFSLDPLLMVTLETPFGQSVSFPVGESRDFVMTEDWFTFTPEFWIQAVLTNKTSLSIIPDLTLSALSVSAGGVKLGPIFGKTLKTSFDIGVFDKTFQLGGFQRIHGQSVTIFAVSEPTTVWLMMLGVLSAATGRKIIAGVVLRQSVRIVVRKTQC